MLVDENQDAPKVDDVLSVQAEFRDGRATARGQPEQLGEVTVPREVLAPDISPRMKERDFLQRDRIDGCGFDVLEVVAALTGKRQVILGALPAGVNWNDVFVGERVGRISLLADAVFATEIRLFADQPSQSLRDSAFSHRAAGLTPSLSINSSSVTLRNWASSIRCFTRSTLRRSASSVRRISS